MFLHVTRHWNCAELWLPLMHQRRPEWQDAINKLSIAFIVFLIDNPPTHNVRLLFVELDRRRFAPKIFCLLLANWLYVINYVSLILNLFFYTKSGGQTTIWTPNVSSGGPVAPWPCDGAPDSEVQNLVLRMASQTHWLPAGIVGFGHTCGTHMS
jgi:hypothetical protein